MAKESHRAINRLIEINTRLAELVQELNPGANMEYIKDALAAARKNMTQAEAFER